MFTEQRPIDVVTKRLLRRRIAECRDHLDAHPNASIVSELMNELEDELRDLLGEKS